MSKAQTRSQGEAKQSRPLADDLIEALQDDRVLEAFSKALSPLITLSVQEAVKKHLEGLSSTVRELKADNTRLTEENAKMQKIIQEHSTRLNDIEAYSRVDNLIIRGLPEKTVAERASDAPALQAGVPLLQESYESVEGTVLEFFNSTLGVRVQPQDISVAHRIKAGLKEKVRPVIVRFQNRQTRNAVYRAKKNLKDMVGNHVFISEHLTKTASDLFYSARKLVKEKRITAAWTQNGQVFIKVSADPTARSKLVKSNADLVL